MLCQNWDQIYEEIYIEWKNSRPIKQTELSAETYLNQNDTEQLKIKEIPDKGK